MSDDGPEQEALFEIQGPDEDGCVWACSPAGRDIWCQNLGPTEKVAEVLSQWLQSIDYDEENFEATRRRLEAAEEEKRQAKKLRKEARPKDHREEGGQG